MADRFINAAKDGYVDPLREATRKDLNAPDEDGMTATTWAAHNGNLEALRLIVGREGDVNKADHHGMTCLHHAALRGHMDVVSYLVNWGCNIYALDNDLHSSLDIAVMNERTGIVKFLDGELAQKERKNPKQASRMKEEAMRLAEAHRKKFEKLLDLASKKAEKEHRKLNQANNVENGDRSKKSFFKSLTLRMKSNNNSSYRHKQNNTTSRNGHLSSKYSDMAGLTNAHNHKGVAKKILNMKKTDANNSTRRPSDFKVSEVDDDGNRTMRSLGASQGYFGSMSEVMYINSKEPKSSEPENLSGTRRPVFDVFHKNSNINSKSKSEPDLSNSSLYDDFDNDDDDENAAGIFNRPQFGQLAFFSKKPFVNTLQSFDATTTSNGDMKDGVESSDSQSQGSSAALHNGSSTSNPSAPWNQDDLDGLDDDEDNDVSRKEFSMVETFLWAAGLAGYLHVFSQEDIDFELLVKMTDSDLKELGLPFGPRKKLEDAIKRRKNVLASPTIMADSFL